MSLLRHIHRPVGIKMSIIRIHVNILQIYGKSIQSYVAERLGATFHIFLPVAYAADLCDHILTIARYQDLAIRLGYAVSHHSGILWREQQHSGIRHRFAKLIDDPTMIVIFSTVYHLYVDLSILFRDRYGIQTGNATYSLHYVIGVHIDRRGVIIKVIIYERYFC